MMNIKYVLEQVEPYLNTLNEISYEEFDELFTGMSIEDLCEIKNILSRNHINYVETKTNNINKTNFTNKHRSRKERKIMFKLSNEQLCTIYQQGDCDALDILVNKNKRFICKISNRELNKYKGINLDKDDVYIEGVTGLIEAANRFESFRGYKFLTYAEFWIRQRVSRAIFDTGFSVRLPVHVHEKLKKIYTCRKNHPEATIKQLIEILENEKGLVMSEKELKDSIILSEQFMNVFSLNEVVGASDNPDSELIDYVAGNTLSAEEEASYRICQYDINTVLSNFKERESEVIQKRFGLNNGYEMTLEEIGEQFNVTRERVRQIEAKTLSKLRLASISNKLRDYYYN